MLATPRNSITSSHRDDDDDVDDLLAEGRAAAEAAANTATTIKSIEHEKYTVEDIEDWLSMTNFYDEAYRQKTLTRHRRLKAIEEEKQQLLREEQEDPQKYRLSPFTESRKRSHDKIKDQTPDQHTHERTPTRAKSSGGRQEKKAIITPGSARSQVNLQRPPDTRYFHIRSWNHENVWAALQDCTWVTQKTNERLFIEAFEQSRRVILFFSVNNSKAFQGVAEMGSIPGAAGLPNPAWRSRLHWPATDAFALIWRLKQDVPHDTVRHLRNPLNENLPAHVGTDGLEIETRVGEQMLSILHEYTRRNNGHS